MHITLSIKIFLLKSFKSTKMYLFQSSSIFFGNLTQIYWETFHLIDDIILLPLRHVYDSFILELLTHDILTKKLLEREKISIYLQWLRLFFNEK